MATNFVTALYPTGQPASGEPDVSNTVGIAVSGGGSRSLSAAIGQYRALKYLGVLDQVGVISSVSGGTWASASFVYLPSSFDDDDFLGAATLDQSSITVDSLGTLSPNNLGHAPTRMGFFSDLELLHHLKSKYGYSNDVLWQGLIGERIFQLWNLWNVGSDGLPLDYYSGDAIDFTTTIAPNNPSLTASQFTLRQRLRPLLVMNASIFSNQTDRGAQLLPFESSPFGIGVRQHFPAIGPGGREIGGGRIQPFAMASPNVVNVNGNLATVTPSSRSFSLVDMASISSAAFAQTIQDKLPEFDGLVPKYPYWPVADPADADLYWFADGGSLENTGINALLARGVRRIISFTNTQTPLTPTSSAGSSATFDKSVQLLFGIVPDPTSRSMSEAYVASAANATPDFLQVFETARYGDLVKGLALANLQNGGPAMFKQTLNVLPNTNFDIAGNYQVEILWVYNTPVPNWINLLSPDVQSAVSGLPHFPNFLTIEQLGLSATEVNALAELSFWNLVTNQEMVTSMF
ncbi:MAG: hypothetical protein QOK37_1257 [Thermoanaerobaculia bacterium]|jgi:hypothetical protein|nr:hypothetical protein [Thermoanaerobaculia bacterium]